MPISWGGLGVNGAAVRPGSPISRVCVCVCAFRLLSTTPTGHVWDCQDGQPPQRSTPLAPALGVLKAVRPGSPKEVVFGTGLLGTHLSHLKSQLHPSWTSTVTRNGTEVTESATSHTPNPRHSMGLPYMPNIDPQNHPNVGIYGIHGVSGNWSGVLKLPEFGLSCHPIPLRVRSFQKEGQFLRAECGTRRPCSPSHPATEGFDRTVTTPSLW